MEKSVLSTAGIIVQIVKTVENMVDRALSEYCLPAISEALTTVDGDEPKIERSQHRVTRSMKVQYYSESHEEPHRSHRPCHSPFRRHRRETWYHKGVIPYLTWIGTSFSSVEATVVVTWLIYAATEVAVFRNSSYPSWSRPTHIIAQI